MRKVQVFGAALATTAGLAVTALPASAGVTSTPTTSAGSSTSPSLSLLPTLTLTSTPTPSPGQTVDPAGGSDDVSVVPYLSAAVPDQNTQVVQGVVRTAYRLKQQGYSYGRDKNQTLNAFWGPSARGPRPAILLLHGGYWLEGSKSTWTSYAQGLASRGYAVFAADYRLSTQKPWPAQRDDVLSVIAWIRQQVHASYFQVDLKNIIVYGTSAGGQLATTVGTYGSASKIVKGVVALSPVDSPAIAYADGGPGTGAAKQKLRSAVVTLIGCTPPGDSKCAARLRDVTPAYQVTKDDVPMLIVHSDGDFVPYAESVSLRDALKRAGLPVVLRKEAGSAHGGSMLGDPVLGRFVLAWIAALVKKP
ncbi:MAG TPA: alpha/beta hydrolase [Streptosporangiaceae bacterium]|nr:alpha/beta hydrolase [Streptosporangiaceae bacterium]